MARFRDIQQFPRACYETDVGWRYVEDTLENWGDTCSGKMGGINLNPIYQRAHVWTRSQQIAYVEYMLRGGEVGRNIVWNSPDWGGSYRRITELVDGKQRLEAVRAFLRGEYRVFGHLHSDFTDRMPIDLGFKFRVCKIEDEVGILDLYLNINAGGTPHKPEELDRVWKLRDEAIARRDAKKGT